MGEQSEADKGRCKSCRWWGSLAFNENHPWHETARLCENPSLRAEPVYEGASGIATQPDFGCVDWEPKGTD